MAYSPSLPISLWVLAALVPRVFMTPCLSASL
jgi:hypothetical protein